MSEIGDWIKERIQRLPSAPGYYWQQVKDLWKQEAVQTNPVRTSQADASHQEPFALPTDTVERPAGRMSVFEEAVVRGQDKAAEEQFSQDSVEYRRQYWNRLAQIDYQYAIAARSGWDEKEFSDSGRVILDWLQKYELCDDSSAVLDVGCGAGRIAYHVAPLVKFLYGIDVSDEMVERAQENLSHLDNVEIRRTDGESLHGFDDQSIDLVYSILVLQHMERKNCYRIFREFARVIRPKGRVLVQLPWSGSQLYTSAYEEEPKDSDLWYGRVYSEDELVSLFERNGFSVVYVGAVGEDLWGVGMRAEY